MESIIIFPISYIAQKEWKYRTIVSIILTLFGYFLLSYAKSPHSNGEDGGENQSSIYYSFRKKMFPKKEQFKEKPYTYDILTMSIPFYRHLWNMIHKHQVERSKSHQQFWTHLDKVIRIWIGVRDENLKENPHLIQNQNDKKILHSCWTNNASHTEILEYLEMNDEYQWRHLPKLIEDYKTLDYHEKINWEHVHTQIQSFFQKIAIQLFRGNKDTPCDCYEPPRFHGNGYANFEDLEKQHFIRNNNGNTFL